MMHSSRFVRTIKAFNPLGPDGMRSMNTRLRLVIEDPRQLRSGCVNDYASQELREKNNDYRAIVVPGLDAYKYPVGGSDVEISVALPASIGWCLP